MKEIEALLDRMDAIGLQEMKSITLMNRIDTKYVMTMDRVRELLALCRDGYRVQTVDGSPVGGYETMYYDTDALDMYSRHHDRQLRRQKIRARTYLSSGLTFIEIKNKNNKGRTVKVREKMPREFFSHCTDCIDARSFVGQRTEYPVSALSPSLRTVFKRITLVNRDKTERLTIDMSLDFENMRTGMHACWQELAIVELKQDGSKPSEVKKLLCDLRVAPRKISKYCIGVAATDPDIKKNRFKAKLRYIDKITKLCYRTY
ncbi:MAG: polyphosphate polymerase domain-containing protein [Bacteroidales bacterium]|nr:polyphosphate polymerase domain-containing protein [Bacteroidales bacterium]